MDKEKTKDERTTNVEFAAVLSQADKLRVDAVLISKQMTESLDEHFFNIRTFALITQFAIALVDLGFREDKAGMALVYGCIVAGYIGALRLVDNYRSKSLNALVDSARNASEKVRELPPESVKRIFDLCLSDLVFYKQFFDYLFNLKDQKWEKFFQLKEEDTATKQFLKRAKQTFFGISSDTETYAQKELRKFLSPSSSTLPNDYLTDKEVLISKKTSELQEFTEFFKKHNFNVKDAQGFLTILDALLIEEQHSLKREHTALLQNRLEESEQGGDEGEEEKTVDTSEVIKPN